MDLSIITVTWNSEDKIAEQISSAVSACEGLEFEQIIVDNGSSDETVKVIEGTARELPVQVIKNKKNAGFAVANNQGVKIAKGNFVLFLNPDMKMEENSMKKMLDWMKEKKDVGIASCKLLNDKNEFNKDAGPRRFPKIWEQIFIILKIPHIFPKVLDNYLIKDFDCNKEQEVDSVRGAFMLVRRELIDKLGSAFDQRYYFWFEDVDFCRECWKNNFKVMYTPIISCVDYVGQSFKKVKGTWKQKNFTKSMLKYFKKWEPWYKWIWIKFFRWFGILFSWWFENI